MKKILSLTLAMSLVLSVGCAKKQDVTSPEIKEPTVVSDAQPTVEVKESEFYAMMQEDTRPVAVMIDNDSDAARPQIGLESAYMVYEIIVEGGASRLMALFKNHDLEKVGPIRSSRHYFLDYALEHDAIYCHAGWSPKAKNDISSLGVNNINGILGSDEHVYWRDNTYDNTWHNMYSSTEKLFDLGVNTKGYDDTTNVTHTEYLPVEEDLESGTEVTEILLPYSNKYSVSYEYDEDNCVYRRFVNGDPHMSQTDDQLTAKNIIIYKVQNFNLADGENVGRQDLKNIGSGTGYYVTNGKYTKINWSKDSRKDKTVYTTEDGEELKLNPGNTYIQIVPANSQITLS